MARIDSILSIVVQQGATELRLGTDREPRMLAHGTPKKLALPATPDDMLRHLLGEILTSDREATLKGKGRIEVAYDAGALGPFHVTLSMRADNSGALDVVLVKGGKARPSAAPVVSVQNTAIAPPPAMGREVVDVPDIVVSPPTAIATHAASHVGTPVSAWASGPSIAPSLASIVAGAAAERASDVHLLDGHPPAIRIDGALHVQGDAPVSDVAALLDGCLDADARARIESGRSVDLAVTLESVGRLRINVYRASTGLAAAIRILAASTPSLGSLHMPVSLDDLVDLPHGLVIVCGPTGSGKSTTLAALAQEALRRRSIVLLSLEDPIEYTLSAGPSALVRQRQVGRDVKDFATGLRDALREDPDVMLIGEMRDPESISLALTAAETGHLVLTSLHSRSTASAIERIVDVYAPERQTQIRVQLADALRAVVAQRLVPRARGSGRVPAVEILRATHNVASVIREGKTAQLNSAIQSGRREGMIPLERCLADLVGNGSITAEDARAVANEPASLSTYLGK